MIRQFENLLRTVLTPAVAAADKVGFLAPNDAWSALVDAGPLLNVYLVDLRENRKLRSSTGTAPFRIDCHYLISAWHEKSDNVPPPPTQSGTRAESELLYTAAALILRAAPMVPAELLATTASASLSDWDPYANHQIPVTLIPPEGFPKLPEFWGTIGNSDNLWKPVLHLIATLPLDLPQPAPGPPILKIVVDVFDDVKDADLVESLITISGTVTTASGVAAENVRVVLTRDGNRFAHTDSDADGRFSFEALPAGPYRLDASNGVEQAVLNFQPKDATPSYDVELS